MYRLMIVEDDASIRGSLEHNYDWSSYGFTVCGSAANGLDALSMLPSLQPDVILTDVKMPRMSGLEFAKQLVDSGYPAKIVFLSAYDDYRFVRDSLRLGAADYLLKPLRKESLDELLPRITSELDACRKQSESKTNSDLFLRISHEIRPWEVILGYLLGQRSDTENVRLLLEHLGISTEDPMTLCSVRFPSETSGLSAEAFPKTPDADPRPLFIPYQKQTVLLFPCGSARAAAVLEKLLAGRSDYQCLVAEEKAFSELPSVFLWLCSDPFYWFYYPLGIINRISSLQKLPGSQSSAESLPNGDAYFLLVRDDDKEGFQKLLDTHVRLCSRFRMNSDIVEIQMAETCSKTASLLQTLHPELQISSFESLYRRFQPVICFSQLSTLFTESMTELYRQYDTLRAKKGSLIEQVQAYIAAHYAENLSLDYLAELFFVNASYLSSVFSKKIGQPITSYLRMVRMEKATELLASSKLSIAEVGQAVGYENYHHFVKLFKSQYHITPTEFRSRFLARQL